jgi:hypothetical protein
MYIAGRDRSWGSEGREMKGVEIVKKSECTRRAEGGEIVYTE